MKPPCTLKGIPHESSAVTPIERLRPNVYVKGPEYANLVLDKTANIFREKALVERHGGRLHFTNGTTFSSTGGLDGVGSAYSSTLLGTSLTSSKPRVK